MADEYNQEFIEKTKRVWRSYIPHSIKDEEVVEITDNLTALFAFLEDLDKKYGPL